MSHSVRELEPKAVWNNFEDLNAVPRPSKKEERVIAFMENFAKSLGLDYETDAVGNVIVRKPASAGMENRRAVVLQSHLDMVHQKNADTDFDFDSMGIQSWIDGEWVKAKGTTLGADNGMGVAAIMTVLASSDMEHPALEALFTIDEESGMTGAHNLQGGVLKGEILMNLDTEDDDELSIGCAGGIDTNVNWTYAEENLAGDYKGMKLSIRGLFGGHSGMDIIYGRGNANKIMNRLLWNLNQDFGVRVASIDGGSLRNAIPRESTTLMAVPTDQVEALTKHIQEMTTWLSKEFASTDPDMVLELKSTDVPAKVMAEQAQKQFVYAVQCSHDGIRRMSPDVDDLVETSNSMARVSLSNGNAKVQCLTRSDRELAKMDMAYSVAAPFHLIGADVEHSGSYPGWKLDPNAPMLGLMQELYKEMFQEEPKVMACHAGLECGLLGQNYPDMEMISFGPTIKHPHSPDEKVNIASVQKFWNYFSEALKRVPVKN
jgi:dipeptidase D